MNTLLVIEDDIVLRNNICELLANEGYEIDHAEDGKIGLEKARKILPDLILCDIMMPQMDGFEVLEELQRDSNTATIPFIFLTAKTEMQNLRRGMKLGADDYLFKPFDLEDLLNAVQTRLKKKEVYEKQTKEIQQQISLKIPHELRTPLVPILGYAEMIEDEEDINQIKDMAKIIRTSGKILHERIEKFLFYKDLLIKEKVKNKGENFLKTTVTEESVSGYLSNLSVELKPERRVKVKVETQTVEIQGWLLGQLVKELVENGLQFSDPESRVFLQGYRSNGHYIINVTDSGRGMSANEIKSVTAFNKFGENQLSEPGLGLGLAIVRKITEIHGGSLSIKSELSKFTTCVVAIPLN